MDVYSSKRSVGGIAAPKKKPVAALKDTAEPTQVCTRVGCCGGRLNNIKGTKNKCIEKPKPLKPVSCSSSSKEVSAASSSKSPASNVKKPLVESDKKLPIQIGTVPVPTESKTISNEPEISERKSVRSQTQLKLKSRSSITDCWYNLCYSITDIKSALTQRALQFFCETYHIPDEVHPQLPNPNQTIHEMPTGKIGVYTRFFEYANFRLPLSTFLVNVLRYYHIHISQLSVIGAAKVSHFEVLCRVHGFEPTVGLFRCFYVNSKNKGWMSFSKRPGNDAVCYTKPLDSLKNWNDRFFWVDSFACPASFPWSTSKGVPKDPFPKSSEFNAEHYAILVAHPAPFHKYPEPFLCLVGINRYYTLDVSKKKIDPEK
ncbi:hypothetical protein Tco_0677949 [Tanacetum coccineum]|uniref:Transposase (putative) gypsy type domain-containing protein n=1 Tax=Tanacetum coccineum TaxID=301880 RepID=A0ABQ4XET4_9ASTR